MKNEKSALGEMVRLLTLISTEKRHLLLYELHWLANGTDEIDAARCVSGQC